MFLSKSFIRFFYDIFVFSLNILPCCVVCLSMAMHIYSFEQTQMINQYIYINIYLQREKYENYSCCYVKIDFLENKSI